jgi:hypothetical protein
VKKHPHVGVFGGICEPISDDVFPDWFRTYQGDYASGVQALQSGEVSTRGYLWGAGMVMNRTVFEGMSACGFTSLLVDRQGSELSSGGDSEICAWFSICGYQLWYDESLRLRHYIPPERLTKDYYARLRRGLNESRPVLAWYRRIIAHLGSGAGHPLRAVKLALLALAYALVRERARLVEVTEALQVLIGPGICLDESTRNLLRCRERFRKWQDTVSSREGAASSKDIDAEA